MTVNVRGVAFVVPKPKNPALALAGAVLLHAMGDRVAFWVVGLGCVVVKVGNRRDGWSRIVRV